MPTALHHGLRRVRWRSGSPVAHNGSVTRDDYVSGVTRQYGYRYTYDARNRLVKAAARRGLLD
ncbi:MAG TPA: hypothetical protein VEB22_09615 [Phycisphaerales bacterium]|nr:hypothetical protein [Phycisphaerales bacterium]